MIEPFYANAENALAKASELRIALNALAEEYPPGVEKKRLKQFVAKLESQTTFRELAQDRQFASWIPVIAAGIQQQAAIRQVTTLLDKAAWESRQRKNRIRTFTYPLFLLTLAAVLVVTFQILVVPSFATMFTEFGLVLPWLTELVVRVPQQLLHRPRTLAIALLLLALLSYTFSSYWTRRSLTTRLFGNAISGNSVNLYAMATFIDTLANLLAIDAPIAESIRIAGRSARHFYFETAANQLADDLERGVTSLSNSRGSVAFPPNMIYALELPSAKRNALLQELAIIYAERVQFRYDWTQWMVGPLAMLVTGGVIAISVIALFLPLFRLITSLSG